MTFAIPSPLAVCPRTIESWSPLPDGRVVLPLAKRPEQHHNLAAATTEPPAQTKTPQTTPQPAFGEVSGNLAWARHNNDFFGVLPTPESGNLSLSEISGKCLQASINAIQIYYAVKTHQHVWERTGTVALQLALGWFIINKITDSSDKGLNSQILNFGMEDRQLAFSRLRAKDDRPVPLWQQHKKLGLQLGDWFHENVQRRVQQTMGLNGDFRSDVLRGATEFPFQSDWNKLTLNEIGWIQNVIKIYEGKTLTKTLKDAFNAHQMDTISLEKAQTKLKNEAEAQLALLAGPLSPSETLSERGAEYLKLYAQESAGSKPLAQEAQQRLTQRMSRLFHLYDHLPFGKPEAIDSWLKGQLTAQKFDFKQAQAQFRQYLGQADAHWETATQKPVAESLSLLTHALGDLVDKTQRLSLVQATDQQIALKQFELAHVNQGFRVSGQLIDVLDPVFRLNDRIMLSRGFLDRRNLFSLAQVALLVGITAAIQGKAMMWVVFNTFARLDPDFDAAGLDKKYGKKQANSASPASKTGSLNAAASPPASRPTVVMTTPGILPQTKPEQTPRAESDLLPIGQTASAAAATPRVMPAVSSTLLSLPLSPSKASPALSMAVAAALLQATSARPPEPTERGRP